MRKLVFLTLIIAPFAFACGGKGSGDGDGSAGTAESGDGDGDGDTTGGGPNSSDECDTYLACVAKVDPGNSEAAEGLYGPTGTCWMEESPADCSDDCSDATAEYLDDNPNALECGGDPLCPGQCCEKDADCNPDFPCCDGSTCFQEGATRCVCTNLPEACQFCVSDCLANMVPPETCDASCKFLCEPDLDYDPIGCRTWP